MTLRHEQLAAGGGVTLEVLHAGGDREGPTVAVLGGVHGDEPEGTLSVQELAGRLAGEQLVGTVLLLPVASPQAAAAGTRTSPVDGMNLARCFPGRAEGSATERVAFAIDRHVIAGCDVLIDLHSAGRDYRMPLFAGAVADGSPQSVRSIRAAQRFGAPIVWLHDTMNPGRSISAAWARGITAIYVESGGGGSVSGGDVEAYVGGVMTTLADLGVIDASCATDRPPARWVIEGGDGNVDLGITAPHDGHILAPRPPGSEVAAGEPLAMLVSLDGGSRTPLSSPEHGVVMMIRHRSLVRQGELVAMLAPPLVELGVSARPAS